MFLQNETLKVKLLGRGFAWLDTGTHESLAHASNFVETIEKRQGLQVSCLEEIAFKRGWISVERLKEIAEPNIIKKIIINFYMFGKDILNLNLIII